MYIERTLSKTILDANKHFKVLLLTGPRQVGKTTLLKQLQKQSRSYVSLDDLDARAAAKEDPAGFVDRLTLPVLIDEAQYAPELFSYIKMIVDSNDNKRGLFWLTGSQQFAMMKNVSESLAGRIAIFDMRGISLAEEEGQTYTPPFIPTLEGLKLRHKTRKPINQKSLFYKIWRGSYPEMLDKKPDQWQAFYASYIMTYVERDAREYLKIDNLVLFRKFMQAAAARTGQMLVYKNIANDVGVSEPTIKSWFNVLEATGMVYLLYPYTNNVSKRILKTPKFYFMDTGLCCFLTKWLNPDVLEHGAMAGALLETYVVSEIIKSYLHNGIQPPLYYYGDKDKQEVDVLIEANGHLHPIEIKKNASIRNSGFKGFDFLKTLKTPIGHGCVLCFGKDYLPFNQHIDIVPIGYV